MSSEVSSSTVFPQGLVEISLQELTLKLESLRSELETDVLYCQTRDAHIRAVTRLAQVVDLIKMIG